MSDQQKRLAAEKALQQVKSCELIGIGSGTTVNVFIDLLATSQHQIERVVTASEASSQRCKQAGLEVIDANQVIDLPFYVDSADEVDKNLACLKGGGAAMTQEKVVAALSDTFICMIHQAKYVDMLGQHPLVIEVLRCARSYVARQLVKMGARVERRHVVTDHGHDILDVRGLDLYPLEATETAINQIPGVVSHGLFAKRRVDVLVCV